MKDRLREMVDIPEKVAMGIGAGGLVLSFIYPPALAPSLRLIIGGGISLGVTQAIWPKKPHAA